MTTKHHLIMESVWLPDSPSETVFEGCGAHIKYMDLSEPGIDAGHLSNQRTETLETNRICDKSI